MNHGYDDDDDLDYQPPARAGPSNLLSQLMGGGFSGFYRPPPASAFDEYYKAYSIAVMGGNERPELLYGGKIVMPASALAKLTQLDIPGPWTFNIKNPRGLETSHCGVLEFIADEGIVHLPAWMMKKLNLNEGDPIKLTGTTLPKGKMVKIQAQSLTFLEVSDPKAVLESALRFYSCLTKGDIIEITYNSLVFEFLIMEITPEGPGISVLDTDLEVDFATPVGYVEPPRAPKAPIPTMADKLKIDLGGTTSVSAGSSRPASRASGGSAEGGLESFTGVGQSLSGKRVKGKGLAKKIEEVDASSKINRSAGPRIMTNESLADDGRKVPAALVLPEGKFFFGFKYVPFDPSKAPKKATEAEPKALDPFGGAGNSLKRRRGDNTPEVKAEVKKEVADPAADPWANLGSGNTLRTQKPSAQQSTNTSSRADSRQMTREEVIDSTYLDEDDFGVEEDFDYGDDVIEIDSD